MELIVSLFYCLSLTIMIELIIAIIFGIRDKKDIYLVILAQVLTNPVVVLTTTFASLKFSYTVYIIIVAIMELLAIIVEGLLYKNYLKKQTINPFAFALFLNMISFIMGFVISPIIG